MIGLPTALSCPSLLPEEIARLEGRVCRHVGNRVRDLSLCWQAEGWVLYGQAATYHAKQLAQEAVMSLTALPLVANQIRVLAPSRPVRV